MVSHEEVSMKHVNVEGLPEPIVRVLEVIVEMARKLSGTRASSPRCEHVTLGVRKGTVYGQLSREAIYDDIA
jgi:hypothetical protein